MYPQPAGVAVRASLASIADKSSRINDADTAVLHAYVCIAVDELRALQWPVERIILRLKQVAAEVGFLPSRNEALSVDELERRQALLADTITQCIEHYHEHEAPSERGAAQCRI